MIKNVFQYLDCKRTVLALATVLLQPTAASAARLIGSGIGSKF